MLDNKNYISRLNRARRRRSRRFDFSRIAIAVIIIAVLALMIGAGIFITKKMKSASSDSPRAVAGSQAENGTDITEAPTLSPEEQAEAERQAAAQEVVNACLLYTSYAAIL